MTEQQTPVGADALIASRVETTHILPITPELPDELEADAGLGLSTESLSPGPGRS